MAVKSLCSIHGCGKPRYSAAGYCSTHQYRFKNYGSPHGRHDESRAHHEEHTAFLDALFAADTSECLIWPYGRTKFGYGQTSHDGRKWLVHTLVCLRANGPKPFSEYQAAHSCGKGHLGCVNPNHLSWKTPQANQADRKAHGTYLSGETSPLAKITASDVSYIRSMAGRMTQQSLADKYGLAQSTISLIQSGRLWRSAA